MANKKFYTFAELLVALRREYVKAYDILEKMKKCIEFDSSVCIDKKEPFASFEYDLRLLFNSLLNYGNPGHEHIHIILDVNKKGPFTLARRGIELIYKDLDYQMERDSECYSLDLDGKCFSTIDSSKHYAEKIYILVDKNEEFLNLLKQLQQLGIWNAIETRCLCPFYVANGYSKIDIDGLGINYSFCKGFYDIRYDAKKDLIFYSTKEHMSIWDGYRDGVIDILRTSIPTYSIPNDYLGIIEKSEVDLTGISIDDYLRRRATLSITKEDGKELVLSKIIK